MYIEENCRKTSLHTRSAFKAKRGSRLRFHSPSGEFDRAVFVFQICPGLNANEIQIACDKRHKVSSLVKGHQNTHSSVKYEVI